MGSVYTCLVLLNLTGANPNRGSVLLVPAELYRDTSQGEQKELGSRTPNYRESLVVTGRQVTECGFENRPADQIVSDLEGCLPYRSVYFERVR